MVATDIGNAPRASAYRALLDAHAVATWEVPTCPSPKRRCAVCLVPVVSD